MRVAAYEQMKFEKYEIKLARNISCKDFKGYNRQIWGGKVSYYRAFDVSLHRWQGTKFFAK